MTKSDLIQRLCEAFPFLYRSEIERGVSAVFEDMTQALEDGDRLEFRGFGAFTVKRRRPRMGRNPKTGASISVEQRYIPAFKAGKRLRERMNE